MKLKLSVGLGVVSLVAACSGADIDSSPSADSDLTSGTEVIFSPQPTIAQSHLGKIAAMIGTAKTSIDVAIYSFSDAGIVDALEAAAKRGVKVRLVFNDGGDNNRLASPAKEKSMSGRLEAKGVDVRFVNKIMHHKFMLVDGPRDSAAAAKTARISTGSANWSAGAGTSFDENTLLLSNQPELALRFQREFNLMWEHSKDFDSKPFPFELSTLEIKDPVTPDGADLDTLLTSSNFTVKDGDTSFKTLDKNTVSDGLVLAIQNAKKSVHLASGHLRSKPVADALIARAKETPKIDLKVYLDDQEFISESAAGAQATSLQGCIDLAGDDVDKQAACSEKGLLFGRAIGDSGVELRYKFYAYRWDFSYAPQMHHKYMIVDGETLYTGSYNLSDNAEHGTFENMVILKGQSFAPIVAKYEANFAQIFETGRAENRLEDLVKKIENDATFPIVFDAIALSNDEVTALKAKIRANCATVDSLEFRKAPASHKVCTR